VLGARPRPQILRTRRPASVRVKPQSMDLSEIDTEHAVQRRPDIEGWRVNLFRLDAWLAQLSAADKTIGHQPLRGPAFAGGSW
jgi:hypothetical protein